MQSARNLHPFLRRFKGPIEFLVRQIPMFGTRHKFYTMRLVALWNLKFEQHQLNRYIFLKIQAVKCLTETTPFDEINIRYQRSKKKL